eukprot:1758038-Rhodomonas_salina.1
MKALRIALWPFPHMYHQQATFCRSSDASWAMPIVVFVIGSMIITNIFLIRSMSSLPRSPSAQQHLPPQHRRRTAATPKGNFGTRRPGWMSFDSVTPGRDQCQYRTSHRERVGIDNLRGSGAPRVASSSIAVSTKESVGKAWSDKIGTWKCSASSREHSTDW